MLISTPGIFEKEILFILSGVENAFLKLYRASNTLNFA